MLLAQPHESKRLRQAIKELQRHRFGRKAEALPEEQMLLGLEGVQQVAPVRKPAKTRQLRKAGRSDLDAKTCPYCKGDLHQTEAP
ncbi:transposase domain-containing protein [Bradyrhizobium sp. ISRA442]